MRSRSACERLGLARAPVEPAAAAGCFRARPGTRSSARGRTRSARTALEAAQILLTGAEIADRRAYVNVRNALQALFALGAVPVVNENDATATDEISFGDNDALAAQVAVLLQARLLVLLTDRCPGVLAEGILSRTAPPPARPRSARARRSGAAGWRARSPPPSSPPAPGSRP